MFKGKKVFISGAAGVIGQELVPRLVQLGAVVYAGDLKPCPESFKGNIKYRQGDLNFISKVELENFQPEIFFHLAATFERSEENYSFWEENFRHNVMLSNHLMTLLKDILSLKKVVFASSYLIYDPKLYQFDRPQNKAHLLKETDPILPRNLTGMAKLSHEIELRFLNQFKSKQFQMVCARIFRGYGLNSRDVISRWIRNLINNDEIIVYRKEGIFDYVFSKDSAEGLIQLGLSNKAEGIINLGTGNGRRVSEIIDILKKYFPDMKVREEDSEIKYESSCADTSILYDVTNWKTAFQLEDAIPLMIDFERSKKQKIDSNSAIKHNILVTSASKKTSLIQRVKEAAAKVSSQIKVFAGDVNPNSISKYIADEFWLMPETNEDNSLEIIDYCIAKNIGVIIPSRDGELLFWSKNKSQFLNKGIYIMISDVSEVNFCLDKLLFFEKCLSHKLNAIPTYLNIDAINNTNFVVKERWGAGSLNIGINLESQNALQHAKSLKEPIYQPYINGVEISVDAYFTQEGKVKGFIARKRNIVVNGESQITTTFDDPIINEQIQFFLKQFSFKGHIVLQGIIDEKNILHWIECNCRFGGASTLSIEVGLDSFYWFLLESMHQNIDDYDFIPTIKSLRQVRVPSDYYFLDEE